MLKENFKKLLMNSIIISAIFLSDRISKIYILKKAELESGVDIYLTPYLNLYLIWNKGIAFGLLSFNENLIYQSISLIILIVCVVIFIVIIKSNGLKKYSLISVLGGALGNFFDRIYYSAVPDFIDFHIGSFHWFIFNVADMFITIGVICLILDELFNYKKNNEIQ
jgi:signal peptidase II|tara:strand:+ start:146 stop:643 length:498 start_codon:yes stop_codon:yes gene_type:complete